MDRAFQALYFLRALPCPGEQPSPAQPSVLGAGGEGWPLNLLGCEQAPEVSWGHRVCEQLQLQQNRPQRCRGAAGGWHLPGLEGIEEQDRALPLLPRIPN